LKIYQSTINFSTNRKTIVTIGTFDGVHIGHQSILKKLIHSAREQKNESIVLTFFPHPRMVLQQDSSIKLLNTIDEKATLLEKFGLDYLIIQPFDETFSNMLAEDFVKNVLIDKLNIHKIIIGHDHRFGKNRIADIDEITISSTKIRKALLDGKIKLANQFLGYSYFISGHVIEGKKIGRTINFPTANIQINESYKLLPKNGVYVISSIINNVLYFGMMNIGKNPTIGENQQSIEVHFFELNENIYNKNLQISILEHIREEQKFNSLTELKAQLERDKLFSLNYIQNLK
jgi:riboflavin kinase/FMN adenylyltransferase